MRKEQEKIVELTMTELVEVQGGANAMVWYQVRQFLLGLLED